MIAINPVQYRRSPWPPESPKTEHRLFCIIQTRWSAFRFIHPALVVVSSSLEEKKTIVWVCLARTNCRQALLFFAQPYIVNFLFLIVYSFLLFFFCHHTGPRYSDGYPVSVCECIVGPSNTILAENKTTQLIEFGLRRKETFVRSIR